MGGGKTMRSLMIQAPGSVILMANKGNLKARADRGKNALGKAYVCCSSKASEDYQGNADQR